MRKPTRTQRRAIVYSVHPGVEMVQKWVADLPTRGDTSFAAVHLDEDGSLLVADYTSPTWVGDVPWVRGQLKPTVVQAVKSVATEGLIGAVLTGIMILATIQASEVIGFASLSNIISNMGAIAAQVLSGLIVLAIGLFLANFVANIVDNTAIPNARGLASLSAKLIAFDQV